MLTKYIACRTSNIYLARDVYRFRELKNISKQTKDGVVYERNSYQFLTLIIISGSKERVGEKEKTTNGM